MGCGATSSKYSAAAGEEGAPRGSTFFTRLLRSGGDHEGSTSFSPNIKPSGEVFIELYSVQKALGSGAYSQVRACTLRATGERRAVKVFDRRERFKDSSTGKRRRDPTVTRMVQQEDHPSSLRRLTCRRRVQDNRR